MEILDLKCTIIEMKSIDGLTENLLDGLTEKAEKWINELKYRSSSYVVCIKENKNLKKNELNLRLVNNIKCLPI